MLLLRNPNPVVKCRSSRQTITTFQKTIPKEGAMASALLNGVDLFYKEAGRGPAILLIHGSGSNADIWGEVFKELTQGHRVIAYDRRGFRYSRHAPVNDYHRHGEDAASLLLTLKAAPATVVGWSGGGLTALDLAVNHPDVIRSLVLVEPPLHAKKHMTVQMAHTFIKVQILRRLRGTRAATRTFLRWASSYTTGGCAFDKMSDEQQEAMLSTADATMGDLDGGTGENISLDQVAAISAPLTCLLGDLTAPAIANATRRIVAAHPGARLVMIPGAGHAVSFDRPRQFVTAVLEAANFP
jgi:pimeloyl-ACP methyl ester carboxylesterase